jgi:hypothetical protein
MDIKSVNSGSGQINKVQSDNLQSKRADETRTQAQTAANKQIKDRLELSSEATLRNSSIKLYAAGNNKIDQKVAKYDKPEVYLDVAKKLNSLFPAAKKA